VRIVTVDRGAGMTPETLGRAGEPFFTTKAPGAGTGLGLFVTRSTVEQLGGRLTLDSRPGLGTTATIMLPTDVVTGPPSHE
jgi:two-component system sensor histidine kinase RegB